MPERTSILYTAEDRTKGATDSVRAQILGLQRDLAGVSASARSFGETFRTVLTGGIAVEFFKDIVTRSIETERSLNMLSTTLRATGHAAGLTSGDIRDLVGELAHTTAFDGDDIQKAANALLRFRDIQGDTFREGLKLVPDLATAMGTDLGAAAQALGRALEDPLTGFKGLRAVTGDLSEPQKELIAHFLEIGNKAAADQVILDQLKGSIGGAAAGDNEGLYGSVRAVSKSWDEFLKALGRTESVKGAVSGTLGFISGALQDLDEDLKRFREADGFAAKAKAGLRALSLSTADRKSYDTTEVVLPVDAAQLARQRDARQEAIAGGDKQAAVIKDRADEARARQAEKDSRALITVRTEAELTAARALSEQRIQILDIEHARGLIAEKDYYAARSTIAVGASSAEAAAISKAIAAQQKVLESKFTTTDEKGAIRANIKRLQEQRSQIESKASFEALKNTEAEKDAQLRLADSIAEVNAQLLEQQGQSAKAAAIRFDIQNRGLRQKLATENTPAAAAATAQLQQIEDLQVATAALNELQQKASLLRSQEALEEERIQNSRKVGAITELEALKQTDAARQGALAGLRDIAAQQDAVANKSPAQVQALAQFKVEVDALAASADLLADKFRSAFQDSLTGPLADFITNTKTAKEAFKDFLGGLQHSMANLASQNISEQIFGKGGAGAAAPNALAKLFSGGGAGGGGFLAGLFGGGASGAASGSAAYATTSSAAGTLFAGGGVSYLGRSMDLPRFIGGGVARTPSIFGDGSMAEAAVPLPDGRRIPVEVKGGGGTVVHMTVNTPDAASFKRSALQITSALNAQLARGRQRQ